MIIINTVSNERFSLNGIEYFKNFLSFVTGDKVAIYNAYDKSDQRIELAIYSDFQVNGVVYGSAPLLQSALLSVIYTRETLGSVVNGLKGSITPTSTPTGTGTAYWFATQAGPYPNHGGFTVGANSFAVFSRNDAGVFSISQTTLDISSKVNVSDVKNDLVSTDINKPLSANQGKVLNEKFTEFTSDSKFLNTSDVNIKSYLLSGTQAGYLDGSGFNANSSYIVEIYALKSIGTVRISGSSKGSITIASVYNSTNLILANQVSVLKSGTSGTTATPIDLTYTVTNDAYYLVICRENTFTINLTEWKTNILSKDIQGASVMANTTDLVKLSPIKSLFLTDAEFKTNLLSGTEAGFVDGNGFNASNDYTVKIYSLKNIATVRILGSTFGGLSIASVYNSTNLILANQVSVLKIGVSGAVETFIDQVYTVTNDTYYLVLSYKNTNLVDVSEFKTNLLSNDVLNQSVLNNTTDINNIKVTTSNSIPSISSTVSSSYIQYTNGVLSVGSAGSYSIEKYAVTAGEYYNLKGFAKGFDVAIWAFLNSSTITTVNLIEIGTISKENTTGINIDSTVLVPTGATFLCITKINSAPLLTVTKLSSINSSLAKTEASVNSLKPITVNQSWLAMDTLNKKLANQYAQHFIDVQAGLNNRYDFGNMQVTANFVVPTLNNSVNISLSNTSLLAVNKKVCIGTKSFYDVYQITAIEGLVITCNLLKSNTGRIGTTINFSNSSTNNALTITNTIRAFNYDDLMAYHSNEIPYSATVEGLHPTATAYTIIGNIIAERVAFTYGKPVRMIIEGDSFTADPAYSNQIATVLGCTIVRHGYAGARVEHILQRFLTYMDTYTPVTGDFFLFYMGTNNLADITRNSTNAQEMFYNLSYSNIFLDAVEQLSARLPLGNWAICSGHANSMYYKENV